MQKKCLYILLLAFISLSCSKDDENGNIPLVSVNFTINVNNPAYADVKVAGGWMYLNGGSRGLILYRYSNDEFRAFDRHCTYEPSNSCGQVAVDNSNINAKDDCCGSKFLITDGTVTQGPANLPLKQYQTSFDGSILRIFN